MKDRINLAASLPNNVLNNIASYLKEVTEEDRNVQRQWLDEIKAVKPYLGFNFEKISTLPDMNDLVSDIMKYNLQTFDSTLPTCVFKLWCLIRGQILPQTGPVGIDESIYNQESLEQTALFIKDELNNYLLKTDAGFYDDYNQFLFYLIFYGSVTRKIYNNSLLKKPNFRFIIPENFLIDNNCKNISDSSRLTHVIYLSKREIILAQREKRFVDPEINYISNNNNYDKPDQDNDGIDLSSYTKNSMYEFQESHVYLDLKEFYTNEIDNGILQISDLPSPYIVTRCAVSNKIVSILPNWSDEDPERKRINCFIHYKLFPGFDIYGVGLARMLGCNGLAQTKIQRMTIDAAIHQNFPGGAYASGAEVINNNINVTAGTFVPMDTGLHSLKDSIMPFPFNGPSPVMMDIADRLTQQMQQLSGTTEITVSDQMQNMPVGSLLASLEVNNRLQSTLLQSIHKSFTDELQLLYANFGFPEEYYDMVEISKIVPTSEPSVESSTQRIVRAETILKVASANPEMHNMHNIYKNMYEALGVENIDNILLTQEELAQKQTSAPAPLDPGVIEMADIQQRGREVESRERISQQQLEGDGYKTQMNIEIEKQKLEYNHEVDKLKIELELEKLRVKEQEDEYKKQIDLLRLAQDQKENKLQEQIVLLSQENQLLRGNLNG